LSLLSGAKRKLDFEPAKGQLLAQSGRSYANSIPWLRNKWRIYQCGIGLGEGV
jgi:hypothetical protein